MRKVTAITLSVAAAALLAVGAAHTANAQSAPAGHVGYIKQPTTSYQYPTNQSSPVKFGLTPGQQVDVVCFTEGQELNGNYYWFRIVESGTPSFVHRDAIAPGHGMPHC
jgi:hypothetical protein